jgi:type IV secretion system protein VirB8
MSNDQSYKKIKTWYSNRYQSVLIQRNILFLFALIAMFSVAIAVLFVRQVLSSKTLEPYVIELDKNTGMTNLLQQPNNSNLGMPVAGAGNEFSSLEKYFLNEFVHAYFSFDKSSYPQKKEKIRLFSTPNINSGFLSKVNPETFKEGTIEARVKSINKQASNKAVLTVIKQVSNIPGIPSGRKIEEVTIEFNFYPDDKVFTPEERLINPLGFEVSGLEIKEKLYED